MNIPITRLFAPLFFLFLSGCQGVDKYDTKSASGTYNLAESLIDSGRYDEAISYHKEVKNKFPYNDLAVKSKLRIADIHFKREAYIEAESAYRTFKEFHPKHRRIDYVTFRLGMSFYNQLPSTIDRDLSLAHKALIYFEETIQSYPNSKFVKKAVESRQDCLKKLAAKELYIADFYFKRKHYKSAVGRYEVLFSTYQNLGFDQKALFGATISAFRSKDKVGARGYYQKLAKKFPGSEEQKLAYKELTDGK